MLGSATGRARPRFLPEKFTDEKKERERRRKENRAVTAARATATDCQSFAYDLLSKRNHVEYIRRAIFSSSYYSTAPFYPHRSRLDSLSRVVVSSTTQSRGYVSEKFASDRESASVARRRGDACRRVINVTYRAE